MKQKLLLAVLALGGSILQAQSYIPVPRLLAVNVAGVPTVLTSTLTSGQLGYTPQTILAKCLNGSLVVDCNFSGGSGSSIGTAGQVQMVGATAGSFAASSATDNGTAFTVSEPIHAGSSGNLQFGANPAGGGYSSFSFNGSLTDSTKLGCTGGGGGDPGFYCSTPASGFYSLLIGGTELFRVTTTQAFFGTAPLLIISGTATANQSLCMLSAGPPVTVGKCTSVVGAGGACTCTSF